ncbi:DEDDh family exonuclease [Streptomyces sp. NPDC048272]|uniref:DEDDh family exonuclease n=1 Tax=Streptomyces sp. NPDC048272 TaxID=3154616 RepID=UPI0034200825
MSLVSTAPDVSDPHDYALDWALVDVETSGLTPRQHRVLSVAVVTLGPDGRQTGEFSTLLDPGCDPGPVHVHGLTAERLRGKPTFGQVAGRIAELLQDRVLVAHNAQFDYDFLAHEFARAGLHLPVARRLCTLALNRRVDPPTRDMRLGTLAAHYGVEQTRAHDALDDTRVLAGILRASLKEAARLDLPLPLVACPPRQDPRFAPKAPKAPCAYRNPGRPTAGGPLVQGMKISITGDTETARADLVARSVAAGLNVMGSVSRHTSVLVTNDAASGSTKARRAIAEGVPVVDERAFLRLLGDVRPGTPHERPPSAERPTATARATATAATATAAVPAQATAVARPAPADPPAPPATTSASVTTAAPATPAPPVTPAPPATTTSPTTSARRVEAPAGVRPLAGRRVLVLGGTHPVSSQARGRVVELGGSAAVNLSASVTDVVLLAGAEADRRMARITALLIPTHDADWLTAPGSTPAGPSTGYPSGDGRARSPQVLPRGGVIDLPRTGTELRWDVAASWAQQTRCEIDVVAFVVDEDEQVTCDEDFVFYGAPENPDGSVRLFSDGPTEQTIGVDLAAMPPGARRVVVCAAIDGAPAFGEVGAVQVTVAAGTGAMPLAQVTVDAATTERTMVLAEVYRRGPLWRFRAVGQGYDHGLAALARTYGVDVAD